MKSIIFFLLVSLSIQGITQKGNTKKSTFSYAAILNGGMVTGSNGNAYSVQTIHGVKKGPWMVGLGIGIDDYVASDFPLVAHGQYWYGKRKAKPFVYAQAGPAFPWKKNEWDGKFGDRDEFEMHTGWLAEGGIGYQWPLGKKLNFFTSAGYSIKQAKYDEMRFNWFDSWWPRNNADISYSSNKLTMHRIIVKVGVGF